MLPIGVQMVGSVALVAVMLFIVLWVIFYRTHRKAPYFFDPQDSFEAGTPDLPKSAKSATFEPLLKHYVGVMQLLITVAAASIAFGKNSPTSPSPVIVAKLLLACSIIYGVLFCALLLWRYDEYGQNV